MHRADRRALGPSQETPRKGEAGRMVRKGRALERAPPVYLLTSGSPAITSGAS